MSLFRNLAILLVIIAATLSGIYVSKWYYRLEQQGPVNMAATVLNKARVVGDFTLQDQNGNVFDKQSLQGKWSFLFFGYTQCPDVCPTTLAMMKNVATQLEQKNGSLKDVQFVFVSVDPERDKPQLLKDYVGYFHPEFIGATGSREQIDFLVQQMSVIYFINKKADEKDYTVDHSSAILLTGPSGNLRALFSTPHVADKIFEAFNQIQDHYS